MIRPALKSPSGKYESRVTPTSSCTPRCPVNVRSSASAADPPATQTVWVTASAPPGILKRSSTPKASNARRRFSSVTRNRKA